MTPGCSVCGYAVEWGRSCYISEWQLFRGSDTRTRGRYVFAPAGTPHYPGWHNLGSRNWTSDERDGAELGEVDDVVQEWVDGSLLANYPPPALLGNEDCIQNGERLPLPVIDRTLRGGWDSRCYALRPPFPVPPPIPPFLVDVRDCPTQRTYALILAQMYDGDGSTAEATLQALYPTATITRVPNSSSITPGTLIALIGDTTVVFTSGTTTPQQWALQAMFGVAGQVNAGTYSTLQLWQTAALVISNRILDAGGSTTGPIVFAGHSYGGAVSCILGARYSQYAPGRSVQVLTYGCPRPGDTRLVLLLINGTTEVHMVNDDDPVTFIPPTGQELGWIAPIVPELARARWNAYVTPMGRIGLAVDGTRTDAPQMESIYALIFRIAQAAVAGETPAAFSAHQMTEYHRRIVCTVAPAPSPPAPPILWLRPDDLAGAELGDLVSLWPDFSGSANLVHQVNPNAAPELFSGILGNVGVRFGLNTVTALFRTLVIPGGLAAGNAHSFYLVARCGASVGAPIWGPQLQGPLDVRTTRVVYTDSVGSVQLLTPAMATTDGIWWCRRAPTSLELGLDGVGQSTTAVSAAGVVSLGTLRDTVGSTLNRARPILHELVVYNRRLDDLEHDDTLQYFREKYGLS